MFLQNNCNFTCRSMPQASTARGAQILGDFQCFVTSADLSASPDSGIMLELKPIMCCSNNISAGLANVSGHDSTRPLPASH